jgi:hypothetical protein
VCELVSALVREPKAARLASGDVSTLENDDFKAALDQLVRSTHASDATAQNDNPSRHASPAP